MLDDLENIFPISQYSHILSTIIVETGLCNVKINVFKLYNEPTTHNGHDDNNLLASY